jgi:pimeloyl-ACP methyl ester carboxylesterase
MTTFRTITTADHDIFVREAGDPRHPTIVLLHGFPTSSAQYQPLIDRLSDRYHLVAPDYPGFGFSSTPTTPVTFDVLTDAILDVLDQLGLSRYSLYLFDFGAPVGFRIAERRPEAIEALILQNANGYEIGIGAPLQGLAPYWQDRAANEATVRGMLLGADATQAWYTLGVNDLTRLDPAAWTLDQALLDLPGRDAIALDLIHGYPANLAKYASWQQLLRDRQWPTLIAWGANDPFFVADGAHAYLTDLPNAELHLLDTGHMATATHTDEIAELINSFLNGHA